MGPRFLRSSYMRGMAHEGGWLGARKVAVETVPELRVRRLGNRGEQVRADQRFSVTSKELAVVSAGDD